MRASFRPGTKKPTEGEQKEQEDQLEQSQEEQLIKMDPDFYYESSHQENTVPDAPISRRLAKLQ